MLPVVATAARTVVPYAVRGLASAMAAPTLEGTVAGTARNLALKAVGVDLPFLTPKGGLEEGLANLATYKSVYREGDTDMATAVDRVRATNTTQVLNPVDIGKKAPVTPLKPDGTVDFSQTIKQHQDYLKNN